MPIFIVGGQTVDVDPAIAAEIYARNVNATRGLAVADPLDSHRDLIRLKTATLLAYLDRRLDVNPDDWQLAGQIMRASCAVRAWVAELARSHAQAVEMAGHKKAATREVVVAQTVETKALAAAARAVARRVWRDTQPVAERDLRHAIKGSDRHHASVEDAIAEAERLKWITPNGALGWVRGEAKPA